MGRASMAFIMLLGGWAVAQTLVSAPAQAQLDPFFYSETCPSLLRIVAQNVLDALQNNSRHAASLLRIHFHDCFVQGCDASVSLNGDGSERIAAPNQGSLSESAFDVIDTIKTAIEAECPNVVSCADVLALSSFFGVILSGGPIWVIPLGRRDALAPSSVTTTINSLPPADSNLTRLTTIFSRNGLSLTDLVALSGGHTIGDARCVSFALILAPLNDDRLYNFSGTGSPDPSLNSTFADQLRALCPQNDPANSVTTTGMDNKTNRTFDNSYFKNFLTNEQMFISDNSLFTDNGNADETANRNITRQLVLDYAANQSLFFQDFAQGMINMGNLNVLTGTAGEIRLNCSVPNSNSSTTAQPSNAESKPEKVSKELSEEEKDKFIDEIRQVVDRVKYEYLAKHWEKLVEEMVVEDGVVSSSHSSF